MLTAANFVTLLRLILAPLVAADIVHGHYGRAIILTFAAGFTDVIDGTLVRVPKAYPAYFGTYGEFEKVRTYLDQFSNLYPVGRNGMHRYNNQDHSMLAANAAVTAIINGGHGRSEIWDVNAEGAYHEEIEDVA